MDISLVARNVTSFRMILRVICSVCFLIGASKPVAIQPVCDSISHPPIQADGDVFNLVSFVVDEFAAFSKQGDSLTAGEEVLELAGDEYWQYHLDCDRWGVVLATPAIDAFASEASTQEPIQDVLELEENNSIADTQPAAQIAVPNELHQPAQRQSVIDFLNSLELPLLDEIDVLLLAAEIEHQNESPFAEGQLALEPVTVQPENNLPINELSTDELPVSRSSALTPELELEFGPLDVTSVEFDFSKADCERWEPSSAELVSIMKDPEALYDFGDSAVHWYQTTDVDMVESSYFGPHCNFGTEATLGNDEAMPRAEFASPLPSIAYTILLEALQSRIWHSPKAVLGEFNGFMKRQFGESLLYQMGEDVMFNIQLDMENMKAHSEDADPAKFYHWTANRLNWMSIQLRKAAISISRTANAGGKEIR